MGNAADELAAGFGLAALNMLATAACFDAFDPAGLGIALEAFDV